MPLGYPVPGRQFPQQAGVVGAGAQSGGMGGNGPVDPNGQITRNAQTEQIPGDVAAQHDLQHTATAQRTLGDITQQQDVTHAQQGTNLMYDYLNKMQPFLPGGTTGTTGTMFTRFGGTGGFGSGTGAGGVGAVPNATLDQGKIDAGNSAAFSKAKDTVGDTSRAAMEGLQRAMASRGFGNGGSSLEASGLRDVYEHGLGELADVSRSQAETGANQNLDIAKTNYQGGVTQRGQTIQAQQEELNRELEAAKAQQAALQFNSSQRQRSIEGLLGAFKGLY